MRGPCRAASCCGAYLADTVGKKAQWALGGDSGVELAHGTGSGVARVDKGFFALLTGGNALALALVQRLKVVAAHIDLPAHFQHRWNPLGQPQGNLANGADVLGHVLARFAITPGSGLH